MITETSSGKVEGFVEEKSNVFLGIPYAAPPLGVHRFLAPAAHEPWSGTRECFAYGPTAPQRDPGITIIPEPVEAGDDFLNLNIFTPSLEEELPVFVWIHGGGFVSGCNRSPWYRGTRFARDGVVAVSIGYRLGVEGFLDMDGAPSNRAVLDWIAALRWVQDNIANFGGDPSRVTIGGQSAGSAACLTLMVNPAAQGLFRGVVAMSGSSDTRMPAASAREITDKVAARLGVKPTRDELARFSPAQLIEAHLKIARNPFTAAAIMKGFDPKAAALRPFVDGKTIPEHPFRAVVDGVGADIPLLAGSTTQEVNGAIRMQRANLEPDNALETLASMNLTGEKLKRYEEHIGSDDAIELVAQASTDRAFRVPLVQLLEDRNDAPTFGYQFAWRSPVFDGVVGAAHCLDIPFAYDNLDAQGVSDGLIGPTAPQHLADEMHREWVRFVTAGDVSWPAYGNGSRPVMVFDDRSEVVDDMLGFERELF